MRRTNSILLALLLAGFFAAYMVTFQISFHEAAVTTTFGKADAGSVVRGDDSDGGGLIGNLHFKWPWPIQDVTKYDLRAHVLEDRLEEQQTRDRQGVIVQVYATWSIDDPLAFFRSLVTEENAERQIRSLLRDARSVLGNYSFDELTHRDPEQLKLAQLEADMLEELKRSQAESDNQGIAFETVGVQRILLPQAVTTTIFERMRATRERLAQNARSEGVGLATRIESAADSDRKIILAFADRRAKEIEAEGLANAARSYEEFSADEEFAIFLRTLETYREALKNQTTFVFDSKDGLFRLFHDLMDESRKTTEDGSEAGDG